MQVILNISLDGIPVDQSFTNPINIRRAMTAAAVTRGAGFNVTAAKLVQSNTEPTLVLTITDDQPGLDNRIDELAKTLHQDCIAVWYPEKSWGQFIGPKAADWGDFNPAFFFTPDRTRLA